MVNGGWIEQGFLQWQMVEFSFVDLIGFNLILLRPSARYNKLFRTIAFRILANIYDGALLEK